MAVTAANVKALIPSTTLADTVIDVYIAAATQIVEPCASGWDDTLKDQIITWLAASLITENAGSAAGSSALKSKSLGDASESYQLSQVGEGMWANGFGKTALMLDTTGCLANFGLKPIVFKVL